MLFQGLFLKANMLWRQLRRREAIAVADGARRLAQENGMTDGLVRVMSSFANVTFELDPSAAVEESREVMALARRTGRRDELMGQIGNFGYHAFIAGRWDEAIAELEPALAEDVAASHRRVMLNNWADIKVSQGEDVDSAIAEMERLEEGTSARASIFRLDTVAQAQSVRGDFKGASRSYQRVNEINPADTNDNLYRAARYELWAGDLDETRRLFGLHLDSGAYGPVVEARRQTLEAGIAALDGRAAEAMTLYRAALKNWRETHSGWDEALTGIDMSMLLDPADPEVAEVVRSTRAILERLRAKPYLEMLDRVVARAKPAIPSPASAPEVAVPAN